MKVGEKISQIFISCHFYILKNLNIFYRHVNVNRIIVKIHVVSMVLMKLTVANPYKPSVLFMEHTCTVFQIYVTQNAASHLGLFCLPIRNEIKQNKITNDSPLKQRTVLMR